ncbi:multicopper oxidase domain-containing protein [Candidatus Uhrbacteria bacterium]|jgi:nitrite reductase (NO-forming)|nr:multicopper oxidase domain-containing protein [Candidatus Uhrbacteria bacterium]
MFTYLLFNLLGLVLGLVAAVLLIVGLLYIRKRAQKKERHMIDAATLLIAISVVVVFFSQGVYPIHFALPPMMQAMTHDKTPASLPLFASIDFLLNQDDFERVENIGRDPNDVPAPIGDREPETIEINVVAKEVISEISDGIFFNYWTYDGSVPGPMWRVRVGDSVELSLTNDETSSHPHNIDLHAVTGPGGGAAVTLVQPGETRTVKWLAKHPGLYVYHCATPNISTHNAHGQYGMILVEPEGGLSEVDKEFYIMQGEMYAIGGLGKKGLVAFDSEALLDENPTYVTFNGIVEDAPRLQAEVGDKIRMYVGNGGVSLISSFHVIGEVFDVVYPEAAIGPESAIFQNVQTTAVLPGGATIVEFTVDVPGNYLLVDHALTRMNKGAWAVLEVSGEENPEVYTELK